MDVVSDAPSTTRIILASSYLLVALVGISPVFLLIHILSKVKTTSESIAFYRISLMYAICNVMMLTTQLTVAVPITILGFQFFELSFASHLLYYMLNSLDTIGFAGLHFFTIMLAANCCSIFILPVCHKKIFQGKGLVITVLLCWVYVIFEFIMLHLCGLKKEFSAKGFYLYEEKVVPYFSEFISGLFLAFRSKKLYFSPVISIILYCIVFIWLSLQYRLIKVPQNNYQRRAAHSHLLFQGLVICILLEMNILAFEFLPYLGLQGISYYYMNLATNVIIMMPSSIQPYILYILNRKVRLEFRKILAIEKEVPSKHMYAENQKD